MGCFTMGQKIYINILYTPTNLISSLFITPAILSSVVDLDVDALVVTCPFLPCVHLPSFVHV